MKLLYDYLPIALFFVTYKISGIYIATIVAIIASIAQVAHFWLRNRRFETMHIVSLVLITTLGGLTLILRDKSFIMWKPTLVNWLFALVFLLTSFIGSKPLIRRMLGSQLELPDSIWKQLNFMWIMFFLISGTINIYFVRQYQTAELELRLAEPDLQESTISELECETGFSGTSQKLCVIAKEREEFWVNFKLFGMLGLTLIFVIAQGMFLYRYMTPTEETS